MDSSCVTFFNAVCQENAEQLPNKQYCSLTVYDAWYLSSEKDSDNFREVWYPGAANLQLGDWWHNGIFPNIGLQKPSHTLQFVIDVVK